MAQQPNNNGDHIYFGSLEQQERQRILAEQDDSDTVSLASNTTRASIGQPNLLRAQPGQQMGIMQNRGLQFENILPPPVSTRPPVPQMNGGNSNLEVLDMSEEAQRAKQQQAEALKSLEIKQALSNIKLPTSDQEVKLRLRDLNSPICYFGEQAIDRRERLRQLCAKHLVENGELPQFKDLDEDDDEDEENQYFKYLGPAELQNIRFNITEHSLKSAALRIEKQKLRQAQMEPLEQEDELMQENYLASKFQVFMSQFGDTSNISKGEFSQNNEFFATAGGSGACKVWTVPNCDVKTELNGHITKVHDIKFHPLSTIGLDEESYANIATCSSDQHIRLWTFKQDQEYQKSIIFKGHNDRVNKILYHPSGDYLLSSSDDKTWKLWDLETQKCIVTQTGHATQVYALALHPDGSLVYSGDFCGQGVLWDLRSGKNILYLQGHVKKILCADFNQNGYQMATGGDDNTLRFWDIRRKHCAKIVPGHLKLISDIKYQPGKSMFLTSVSYDNSVKVWNSQTFDLTSSLGSHESRITGVSFTSDSQYMATTSLDRKFMLWRKSIE